MAEASSSMTDRAAAQGAASGSSSGASRPPAERAAGLELVAVGPEAALAEGRALAPPRKAAIAPLRPPSPADRKEEKGLSLPEKSAANSWPAWSSIAALLAGVGPAVEAAGAAPLLGARGLDMKEPSEARRSCKPPSPPPSSMPRSPMSSMPSNGSEMPAGGIGDWGAGCWVAWGGPKTCREAGVQVAGLPGAARKHAGGKPHRRRCTARAHPPPACCAAAPVARMRASSAGSATRMRLMPVAADWQQTKSRVGSARGYEGWG